MVLLAAIIVEQLDDKFLLSANLLVNFFIVVAVENRLQLWQIKTGRSLEMCNFMKQFLCVIFILCHVQNLPIYANSMLDRSIKWIFSYFVLRIKKFQHNFLSHVCWGKFHLSGLQKFFCFFACNYHGKQWCVVTEIKV